jgi:membrane peptidoglycan carboxypeptidase
MKSIRRPRKRVPSIRRCLIRIHSDLLDIHRNTDLYHSEYPYDLTTFEKMVITLEDRRFFHHSGFDIRAVLRSTFKFMTLRNGGGASTLDMQFVRVCTGRYERTIARKVYEIFLSFIIQFRYSKLSILRSYLNIAYFGTGLEGADSAAFLEFGKSSQELDIEESARIASFLVFPRPRAPSEKWEKRVSRRANYIKGIYPSMEKKLEKSQR